MVWSSWVGDLMHYYERNIGDYHRKAGRLNILQHGVYNLLIDACYDREQFPESIEEAIDWVWAETDEEIKAVEFVIKKFFKFEEGFYVQNHIKEDLAAYKAFNKKQSENGKKGGRPPKNKKSDNLGSSGNDLDNSGSNNESQENPTETQNNPNKPNESLNHRTIEPINQEPFNQFSTHTLSASENENQDESWKPDSNFLLNVIRESVGIQAQSVLDMADYDFHLGNFNAHWENKTDLTENQRTRKFAQWLILEFKKIKPSGQQKTASKTTSGLSRNVNDAWPEIPEYAPAADIDTGDML